MTRMPTIKVTPLFFTAQLILRITLQLLRWRRLTPAFSREATKVTSAVQKLLSAIMITLLGQEGVVVVVFFFWNSPQSFHGK